MKPMFFKGALVGGLAGAVMAVGTVALAGTGIGGVFNLGVDNSVDGQTLLHGNTGSNPQLRVNNQQGTDGAIGVLGAHAAGTGAGAGIQGDSASTAANASGVYGRMTSANAASNSNGVRGINSGAGRGVYGQGASGPGVFGSSTSGYGVWGIGSYGLVGSGPQGGVWTSTDGSAASGVYAQTTAAGTGSGVHGIHIAGSGPGAGVRGETNSSSENATGILARANSTNAGRDNVALRAINNNTNHYGMGVWGSIAGSGWGVLGEAGSFGTGVIGKLSGVGTGVQGQTGPGGTGVRGIGGKTGVYGQATDPGGYAFAAQGDAGQNRSGGGWVKAMAYIDPRFDAGAQVRRCFNSQVSGANCGIKVMPGNAGPGVWIVDFGFDVHDRFVMVTPYPIFSASDGAVVASACTENVGACNGVADTAAGVYVVYAASTRFAGGVPFSIFVF